MADNPAATAMQAIQDIREGLYALQAIMTRMAQQAAPVQNHGFSIKQISQAYNAKAFAAGHGVLLTVSPPENQAFHVPFPSSVEAFNALDFESLSSLLTSYNVVVPETVEEARARLRDVITGA